jgi:hypothetical protein
VYQEIDGVRHRVAGDYVVDGDGHVRVHVGTYDASRPLVIDPILAYSTYLGGTWDDADEPFAGIEGVALDGAGNIYVTGTTQSPDFPTTAGADRTLGGTRDIFVTKLSRRDGPHSTFLGDSCDDAARDIAVTRPGRHVTGRPAAAPATRGHRGPGRELDPAGSVVCASVLGGGLADSSIGHAIAVDGEGHRT